jgi:choline dehydrogenase-like flavoprotein
VPNLFISDGSAFATAGAADPTATIIALVLRHADSIARELGAGTLQDGGGRHRRGRRVRASVQ